MAFVSLQPDEAPLRSYSRLVFYSFAKFGREAPTGYKDFQPAFTKNGRFSYG
jgi:hypothetical protein